jgi:hypothetical protein
MATMSVAANANVVVTVQTTDGVIGDEVTVTIDLTSHAGVMAVVLGTLEYDDSILTLVRADFGGAGVFDAPLRPSGFFGWPGDATFIGSDPGADVAPEWTGTLVTLTFEIIDDMSLIDETTIVTLSGYSAADLDGLMPPFPTSDMTVVYGTLTLREPTTLILTPPAVNLTDTVYSADVEVSGTATGAVEFSAVPDILSIGYYDGTITVTANRPAAGQLAIPVGSHEVTVTREGVEEILTVNVTEAIQPYASTIEKVSPTTAEATVVISTPQTFTVATNMGDTLPTGWSIAWTVGDYATVVGDGLTAVVTGVEEGTATIRATLVGPTGANIATPAYVEWTVNVQEAPIALYLVPDTVTITDTDLYDTVEVRGTTTGNIGLSATTLADGAITLAVNQTTGIITVTGVRPEAGEDDIDETFTATVTRNGENGETETLTIIVNLTALPAEIPTLTLTPDEVTITDAALTATVTAGGTAAGAITFNRGDLPAAIDLAAAGNTITVTATRPTDNVAINDTFEVGVTREGITETLTVNVNLTPLHPTGLLRVSPDYPPNVAIILGETETFTVALNPDYVAPDEWEIQWTIGDETIIEFVGGYATGTSVEISAIAAGGPTTVTAQLVDSNTLNVGASVIWNVYVPADEHAPLPPGFALRWPALRPPPHDVGGIIIIGDGDIRAGDVIADLGDRDWAAARSAGALRITAAAPNDGLARAAIFTIPLEVMRREANLNREFLFILESAAGGFHLPANLPAMVSNWSSLVTNAVSVRVTIHRQNITMHGAISPVTRFIVQLVDANGRVINPVGSWNGDIVKTLPVSGAAMPDLWEARVRPIGGDWSTTFVPATIDGNNVRILVTTTGDVVVQEVRYTVTDTAGHWADGYVRAAFARRLVNGMTGTTFVPEGELTGAQFTAMISRALRLPLGTGGAWYAPYVTAAREAGIIGFLSADANMGEAITRQDMAGILARAAASAGLTSTTGALTFTDADDIAAARRADIQAVVGLDLMRGRVDGSFGPTDTLTRAEAATVLVRFARAAGWMD